MAYILPVSRPRAGYSFGDMWKRSSCQNLTPLTFSWMIMNYRLGLWKGCGCFRLGVAIEKKWSIICRTVRLSIMSDDKTTQTMAWILLETLRERVTASLICFEIITSAKCHIIRGRCYVRSFFILKQLAAKRMRLSLFFGLLPELRGILCLLSL